MKVEKQRKYEEDMKNYLDQEMTNILDKIKGIKSEDEEGKDKKRETDTEGTRRGNDKKDDDKNKEQARVSEKKEKRKSKEEVEERAAGDEPKGEEDREAEAGGNAEGEGQGGKKRNTRIRTTVTRTVTSSISVKKKEPTEDENQDEEDSQPKEHSGFKGLGRDTDKKAGRTRTKTTVNKTKKTTNRNSYGGRLIGTNPDKEISEGEAEDIGDSLNKVKGDHLLSRVTQDQRSEEEPAKPTQPIQEENPDADPGTKRKSKPATSILKRKSRKSKTRKSVWFQNGEIEQTETDPNEEFIRKVPTGTILLTNEQRDMLIEVLEEPDNEEDDLILSLEPEQVKDVVVDNFTGENATVAVDLGEKRSVLRNNQKRVSIYPKNFFAMVEKQKLKGSRISVYPGKFFDDIEKGLARKDPGRKEARVSTYPKDLFDLVEHEIDEGRISVYPQEMFDLFNECEDKQATPAVRKKAQTIYPGEFLNLVDKQTKRANRSRQRTVYPRELFDLAEQEKVNGERVSVYPRELFKLLSKEAQSQRASVYPKDLFDLLDTEYSNVIKLTPAQSKLLIQRNLSDENTHIVLSENQRKDLLGKLKDHKRKEKRLGPDRVEGLEVDLEKDQVMDILNQNCMVDGAEINLTEQQVKGLKKVKTVRPTIIGNEYYDVMVDQLINAEGDRLELNRVSGSQRRSLLKQLGPKKMSVIEVNDDSPEVLSQTHYDPKKDEIVNLKSRKSVSTLGDDHNTRKSRLSKFTKKSINTRRRTSVIGMAYYDAMVNELVDESGNRHSLDDKSPKEIQGLVDEIGAETLPVLVEGDKGEEELLLLNQVDYVPGEDCLVDEKGRKTVLNDLSNNERKSLMKILGETRGSRVSGATASQFSTGGKRIQFGSHDTDSAKGDRDLDKIRKRKKTGYPTDLMKKRKEATDKVKRDILQGKTRPGNRGSMANSRGNLSSKSGRKRLNTMHPKGRESYDRLIKTSADDGMTEEEGPRGKNIRDKRMTVWGSPKSWNVSDKRKTMGSGSGGGMSREELRDLAEQRRKQKEKERLEREKARLEREEKEQKERQLREQKKREEDEKRKAEQMRRELELKRKVELEKAKKKAEREMRLEQEKKRIEDLRLANERKRIQQLKIAQEKRRIEEERLAKHKKKNEELRRASELRRKKKQEEEDERRRKEQEEEDRKLREKKEADRKRREELRKRTTVKDLKKGKGKNRGGRANTMAKSPSGSTQRSKAKTVLVKDRKNRPETEEDSWYVDTDTQGESISRRSKWTNKSRKTRPKNKTISNIHEQYYAGGENISSGKHIVSEGMNLMGGEETPSDTSKPKTQEESKKEESAEERIEEENNEDEQEDEPEEKPESKAEKQDPSESQTDRNVKSKRGLTAEVGEYGEPTAHFIREYEMEDQPDQVHSHKQSNRGEHSSIENRNYSKTERILREINRRHFKNAESGDGSGDPQILSEQQFPSSKKSSTKQKNIKFLTEEVFLKKNSNNVHELIFTEDELNAVSDEELRRKIRTIIQKEKPRFSKEIIEQCEDLMEKHGLGQSATGQEDLLDEFYRFCQETLPHDQRYKESVLFVSMFYYFLERKKLIR